MGEEASDKSGRKILLYPQKQHNYRMAQNNELIKNRSLGMFFATFLSLELRIAHLQGV